MTTLELVKRAKKEIEKAISAKNTIIGKAFDTQEYQFSQMGRAAALLEIAIIKAEENNNTEDCDESTSL